MTSFSEVLFISDDAVAVSRFPGAGCATTTDEALRVFDGADFNAVVVDLGCSEALEALEMLRSRVSEAVFGVIEREGHAAEALQALRLGAVSALPPGSDFARLEGWLNGLLAFQRVNFNLGHWRVDPAVPLSTWVGRSPVLRQLVEQATQLAPLDIAVAIRGPRGSGKKHLARLLVANDASRPSCIFEPEVLPVARHVAEIERALGKAPANLIIAEVGFLSREAQKRLVSYLPRLRLITTSSLSHDELVNDRGFNEGLQLHMAPVVLSVPPLAERREDVSLLAAHFLRIHGSNPPRLARDVLQALVDYDWPGSVAELVVELTALAAAEPGSLIKARQLPPRILEKSFYRKIADDSELSDLTYVEAKKRALNKFNRSYILELLRASQDNITVAAERAGMDRSNFKKIIRRYQRVSKDG